MPPSPPRSQSVASLCHLGISELEIKMKIIKDKKDKIIEREA